MAHDPLSKAISDNITMASDNSANNNATDVVFEYMGNGQRVPQNVTKVCFHSSVVEIDPFAFYGCRSLREVEFNKGLQAINYGAFTNCTSIQSVTLPFTMTKIDGEAFYGCNALRKVVLNRGLQTIGSTTFSGCPSLQSITLTSTVTEIGDFAFQGCNLRDLVLNEGLERIKSRAFEWCSSLQTVTLPSTITEIGDRAFHGCNNLRVVILNERLQTIGNDAFDPWSSSLKFTIPSLSTRMNNIVQDVCFREKILVGLRKVHGVVLRVDRELFVPAEAIRGGHNWRRVKADIDSIIRFVSEFEIWCVKTLIDLAIWKCKIDELVDPKKRNEVRIFIPVGAKESILQFLGN